MEFKDKIIMETKAYKQGNSVALVIPSKLRSWIELEEGDKIKIMTENGKYGRYIAIWKKEQ